MLTLSLPMRVLVVLASLACAFWLFGFFIGPAARLCAFVHRRFCIWRAESWEREAKLHAKATYQAYMRADQAAFEEFDGYRCACNAKAALWRERAARHA